WTLELSCDNTNIRVPTLELVDEILEGYIGSRRGPHISRARVYQETLSPRVRTAHADSFHQPFHLPLARVASYLPKLGPSLAAVADAVAAPESARVRAEL